MLGHGPWWLLLLLFWGRDLGRPLTLAGCKAAGKAVGRAMGRLVRMLAGCWRRGTDLGCWCWCGAGTWAVCCWMLQRILMVQGPGLRRLLRGYRGLLAAWPDEVLVQET